MANNVTPDVFGNLVDQLVTIEGRVPVMPQDVLKPLYEAAHKACGGRPVTMSAAEGLIDNLKRGDTVFVMSGAGVQPTLPRGESDGPPGAAMLARILYKGLGAVPVFVSAEGMHIPIVDSSKAAGLVVKDSYEDARDWGLGAAVANAPGDQSRVAEWSREIIEEMKPKAVFSTECLGPGKDGLLYTATGIPLNGPDTKFRGCIDISPVWTEAEKRGIFRIGVGDWGNELGFGSIWDAVAKHVPKGDTVATVTKADVVVPAVNSNWGTIGVESCLAFLLKRPDLMHTPEDGERILRACIDAGGYESIYCSTAFSVDFLEGEAEMALAQLLGSLLRQKLTDVDMGMTH